jgi:hypothetical protein
MEGKIPESLLDLYESLLRPNSDCPPTKTEKPKRGKLKKKKVCLI